MIDYKQTATTRHFCAAAHLNWRLRNQVINNFLFKKFEAIGPSPGVDLVAVLKHCIAARRRKMLRDILLSFLFVFAVFFGFSAKSNFLLFICLAASWVIVFSEDWISHRIIGKQLSKGSYEPDSLRLNTNSKIEKLFKRLPECYNPNMIVYSGYYPFVGSGPCVGGWTLALDVEKGKKQKDIKLDPLQFSLNDLYDYLICCLRKLNIENLTIEENLYVSGKSIRKDRRFISNPFTRPHTQISTSLINEFKENPNEHIRYYLSLRVIGWDGELVLSIFLRFYKLGKKLYAETSYHLLPPFNLIIINLMKPSQSHP